METKEQIRQRIQKERGEYTREKTKRYLHYKNIGRLDLYYKRKIPMMPRINLKTMVSNLKWWQRIYIFLILLFKKIWRRIKRKN